MRTSRSNEHNVVLSPEIEGKKHQRVNFIASVFLLQKIKIVANESRLTTSDIIRRALELFVERYEREKLEREIAEACKNYREFNKGFSSEWAEYETRVD
jgi:hypothetical protein